jgi:hypothetical protein
MTDLNDLVPEDSSLYMVFATWINDIGEIVGYGVDKRTEEIHAFLASPVKAVAGPGTKSAPVVRTLPVAVRKHVQGRIRISSRVNAVQ